MNISRVKISSYTKDDEAIECAEELVSKKHTSSSVKNILKKYHIDRNNVDFLKEQLEEKITDRPYLNFLDIEIDKFASLDISKILLKEAKILLGADIDNKLFWMKSKQGAKNQIYKYIEPLTRGIFRDEYWKGPNDIWKKLKSLGLDVEVEVKNGGYFNKDGEIAGKKYNFKIEYVNIEGKKFEFAGELICSFCGTIKDPMEAYDLSFIMY